MNDAETRHDTVEGAKAAFMGTLTTQVESCDNLMGAVWSLKDGRLDLAKTTCQFPRVRYLEALLLLKEMLDREVGLHRDQLNPKAKEIQPLPQASQFAARIADVQEEQPSTPLADVKEEDLSDQILSAKEIADKKASLQSEGVDGL